MTMQPSGAGLGLSYPMKSLSAKAGTVARSARVWKGDAQGEFDGLLCRTIGKIAVREDLIP